MFDRLQNSAEMLIREITQIAYFMRGGITYDDLMFRTPAERDIISDVLRERIEFESKLKL